MKFEHRFAHERQVTRFDGLEDGMIHLHHTYPPSKQGQIFIFCDTFWRVFFFFVFFFLRSVSSKTRRWKWSPSCNGMLNAWTELALVWGWSAYRTSKVDFNMVVVNMVVICCNILPNIKINMQVTQRKCPNPFMGFLPNFRDCRAIRSFEFARSGCSWTSTIEWSSNSKTKHTNHPIQAMSIETYWNSNFQPCPGTETRGWAPLRSCYDPVRSLRRCSAPWASRPQWAILGLLWFVVCFAI